MLFIKSKKVILLILISIALLLFALYLTSASDKFVSQTILINTNQNSLIRFFSDDDNTGKWLNTYIKAKHDSIIKIIRFHHYYSANVISLQLKIGDDSINSEMSIVAARANSTYIRWRFDQPLYKSLIKKIERILKRNAIDGNMLEILFSLKEYTEKSDNIYGCTIQKMRVKDTLLVVIKSVLDRYPGIPYVYNQIRRLRKYISQQQAEERNFPMLYVFKTDKGLFETNIALPINKFIKSGEAIVMQRMVAGDILWTECKGGPSKIRKSFNGIESYMQDYQNSSPALPFELLVTNRLNEPDTLQWITRIYYPIY